MGDFNQAKYIQEFQKEKYEIHIPLCFMVNRKIICSISICSETTQTVSPDEAKMPP